MRNLSQLIITRRGILDISEVTLNDEVYTAKRRWRKVTNILTVTTKKVSKSNYSFLTPIAYSQTTVTLAKNTTPYYIPRDRNADKKTIDYWFTLGKNLSNLGNLLSSETFSIPINIILMDKIKCKAFLEGFFSNNIKLKQINKRARLALSFMIKKLDRGYEYRSTFSTTKKDFTKKNGYYTIKILNVEEDESYCINGLYVKNK